MNCRKYLLSHLSHVTRKPAFGVIEQIGFKPACSATAASYSLDILDIASIGIVLLNSEKKGAD